MTLQIPQTDRNVYGAVGVHLRVGDGGVEVGEEVVLVREPVECSDGAEEPEVVGARTFDQHGDPACFELRDDLRERLGAGRVEHLEVGEAQDHDLHVGDCGQLGEESLRGAEEERAVDAIADDAVAQQRLLRQRRRCLRRSPASFTALADLAILSSARIAASAMPSSTATMRSKAIVAPAVSASTNASERVEKSTARTLWTSTMRIAVSMSTPASAASGIRATSEPPDEDDEHEHERVDDRGDTVRAPARTFTAVRAIAPVAGMPPKSGEARFGEALPEQLTFGVVAGGVGHAVGDLRRQQALHGGEQRHRDRRAEQVLHLAGRDTGQGGHRERRRATRRCAPRATRRSRRRPWQSRRRATMPAVTDADGERGSSPRS